MSKIVVAKVGMTLVVRVPDHHLHDSAEDAPTALARLLADQVIAFERSHKTGYFPPLEYLEEHAGIDSGLLERYQIACQYARQFARRGLRAWAGHAFSSLQIRNVSNWAYAMPRVLVRDRDARDKLAQHYAPNLVRLELVTSSIEKGVFDGLEKLAEHKLNRWLKEHFDSVEVTGTHLL